MKQKLLFLLVALAFLLPARLSAFNYKYEGVTLRYEVIDEEAKTCKVIGYKDFSGDLVIPDVANDGTTDYPVVEIGEAVFNSLEDLTSVVIGNSVTSIGNSAFSGCSGLTSCEIPNSVQTIGSRAFYGCSGLTSLVIPNSVTSIGDWAFRECSGITSVVIGNSVQTIGVYAFDSCSSLTSLVIGNSVTEIEGGTFRDCTSLESVVFGKSVQTIYQDAFQGCSRLTKNAYPNTLTKPFNEGYMNIDYDPEEAIIEDGFVWGLNKSAIYFAPLNLEGEYIIPESVTSIGRRAFSCCRVLSSVEIPNSVQTIGYDAFYGCSGLTSVVIPNSVTSIGTDAFNNCSGLTKAEFSSIESLCNISFGGAKGNPLYYAHHLYIDGEEVTEVVIPESVTSIGGYTFSGCRGLTSVVIGNSVTSIGGSAFDGCSSLASVEIPNSVKEIGGSAFSGCSGLTSMVIGSSVQTIGKDVFNKCDNLTTLTFNAENCTTTPTFPNSLNTLIFGDKVTYIPAYAFSKCEKLTSVKIPNSVIEIDKYAFNWCTSLTTVELGNSLTSIGEGAFSYCSNLTAVEIPNSVTTINYRAFESCIRMTSLVIGNSVTFIGKSAFYDCRSLSSLTFNAENLEYEFTSLGKLFPESLEKVVIGNNVRSIPANLFRECINLNSVVIPNSVTSIGNSAFNGCSLDTIVMGYGIKSIGSYAFSRCPASKIYITAQTPPEIESYTFGNYKGILYLQGQAAVNAYDDDKYWGNFNNELMTVATALEIEGMTSISGNAGDTFQLKAKMTPEDVTLPYVLWRSTNPKIATVDNNGLVKYQEYSAEDLTRAEGDEENDGTCKIIAESLYYDGPIAEVVVNNTGIAAASISLDESNLELKVGQSATLTATVKNVEDKTVTWTSSNEAVATVDAEGKVTALAVGESVITATCGSVSASCNVTVLPIPAESITLSQDSWSANAGEIVTLTATVLPENTTDKTVTWTSSDASVAYVTTEGVVTAVSVGEAVI
ncbi:MAG: leucine-rich repeat protein, partial [Muribaculaceae bacterium]|nr:leucine-rich repeat protein [Muribaculaceae bacterium]